MESNRRDVLKTVGAAAGGLALAGCLGSGSGSDDTTNDTGDETVTPGDPGWFDVDSNVFEERMGQELEVTKSSLYRTADDFGVQFTVANRRGAPVTSLTVHVDLMGADDEVLDGYTASFPETESIDDLATNETWSSDVVFENTDPSVVFNDLVAYRIWVTAEAEGTAPANASSSGVPSANGTADSDATNASTMGNDTMSNDTTADGAMNETEMTNSST